jgi:Protein of unknown function (DUF1275)
MQTSGERSDTFGTLIAATEGDMAVTRLEDRLPPLLSVIAGMVDLTGFFTLGNIFTAHVTGNLVLATAALVRGGRVKPATSARHSRFHACSWLGRELVELLNAILRWSERHVPGILKARAAARARQRHSTRADASLTKV